MEIRPTDPHAAVVYAQAMTSPQASRAISPTHHADVTGTGEQAIREAERSSLDQAQLTPEERRQVARLQARDREVRAHEAAHKAAAGSYARGGASFEYQTGPDGRRYAVGGEVSIDASPIAGDPEATMRKMQQVRRAALAPADPSPQDIRVAAQAAQHEAAARHELQQVRAEEMRPPAEPGPPVTDVRVVAEARASVDDHRSRSAPDTPERIARLIELYVATDDAMPATGLIDRRA
jgi:hypothetical protein